MTPQELQALDSFLAQLTQAQAGTKDPQAEARIADAVARQPDAAYLLVQRAMLLDQALASAKAQIAQLQTRLQTAQAAGSGAFLDPASTWGQHANALPPSAMASAPMPPAAQPAPVQPSRPGFFGDGVRGALGSIATTAAGVAGGAFLFQGIENLFHRNSGSGFLGQPAMGMLPTETTVINNYYDNDDAPARRADAGSSDGGLPDTGLDDGSFTDDDTSMF
ncbi:DUF2076 domain-containing protein [Ralstonia solanacearum]|uniref:DUF2076 domain-containing protein n=1 Tax=Ralstonia solanacearum (strain Po82) TaxID=1031711 RepID=F6G813_RALS8|nr:DUF2076 domain-containing protein [Ralstonia solanacearum]AEG70690.1 conserved hypothetical protein [Ralstonia solanacearum Po82]AMP71115.1 ABC transporter substrate-binding protein [Ralstonia solanacearum]AMP76985.1 ABC transporter substrate-binding protein [Ralstonia solanacearum]AYB62221.1 DUF2076 domain-containing protein [Ralstonia solanacearum]MBB6588160.1 DUF2076 domain-containing protein [Ralstonia solanacearum]